MVLADSCFNLTHDSFDHDLYDVIEEAQNEGIEYFFTPSSSKLDIEKYFMQLRKFLICSVGEVYTPTMPQKLTYNCG